MNRATVVAQIKAAQQTLERLLALLESSEQDRFALYLPVSPRLPTSLRQRRQERKADRRLSHRDISRCRKPGIQRRLPIVGTPDADWRLRFCSSPLPPQTCA